MELNFRIYITLGTSTPYQTDKWFSFDYDTSYEDWDEFAKSCDFKDGLDLLLSSETDEDTIKEFKEEYNNKPYYCECYLSKHSQELFREFLQDKYEDIITRWIGEHLTIDGWTNLNDILDEDK